MDDLDPEIRQAHLDLGDAALALMEYTRTSEAARVPLEYEGKADLPAETVGGFYPIQSWPLLISEEKRDEMARINRRLVELLRRIPEKVFAREPRRFASYFGAHPDSLEAAFFEEPNGLSNSLARCDFVIAEKGLQCLEVNLGGNIGGWQLRFWEHHCRENPPISEFFAQHGLQPIYRDPLRLLLRHIINDSVEKGMARSGELNVCIAFDALNLSLARPAGDGVLKLFSEELKELGTGLQGTIILCDYANDLRPSPSGEILYGETPVHALVEFSTLMTPAPVYQAMKAGLLCLYNGPLSRLVGGKSSLAVLSELEGSGLFDDEERDLICRHVPWCRTVSLREVSYQGRTFLLPELLAARREEFVLKPSHGASGEDVLVGRFCSPERWAQALEVAVASGRYVVQEYVESRPYLFLSPDGEPEPHDVIWGLFCFGTEFGGTFLRLAPKRNSRSEGVINSARGAVEAIVYEV